MTSGVDPFSVLNKNAYGSSSGALKGNAS
jgi:microfibrillar-associated protein 1